MKYSPRYPLDGFQTIEEVLEWGDAFADWCNNKHYHSGLKFMTPSSRHNGGIGKIMNNRKRVYETAIELNLQRFKKGIRSWDTSEMVALNPTDEVKDKIKKSIV
ncbi:hypothetical protein [Clostridium frigidicarnis]|uniref:Integrase core domain-containing protein n=1 Tax=Clostridium frigidicarnis TaxID=84698 RepID=A0A1I1B4C8_9CLOT|nr:hypothetical protein [Clostridium frigidicarnis]SFB44622.1 hypothetical protein SAMN04488528_10603 [Clostridium frigidicarnis]